MKETLSNLTFILGGARSGKSTLAEQRASEYGSSVIYCATAEILDEEMRRRVEIHRSRRPAAWRTVDAPHGAASHLEQALHEKPAGCILLDCLSVLTSNVLLSLDENIPEAEAFSTLGAQELDPDEFLDVFRMPLKEAVEMVMDGRIPDSKTQTALLKAARVLGV